MRIQFSDRHFVCDLYETCSERCVGGHEQDPNPPVLTVFIKVVLIFTTGKVVFISGFNVFWG